MSDKGAIIEYVAEAWDRTDLSQSQFAALLRSEADTYENAPELASDPNRLVPDEGGR